MKIIIDECVPSIVKSGLPGRNIVTVQEMEWAAQGLVSSQKSHVLFGAKVSVYDEEFI